MMQSNQRVHSAVAPAVRASDASGTSFLALAYLFGLLGLWSLAWCAPATQGDVATHIKQTIESRFPGFHVLDVKPSAMPGIYEVFMGDQIVYTDSSADYVIVGTMVDTQTRENLTEVRMNERGRIDFNTLPFDRAIKIVKGNGSRRFAVFSDPDCPFCQQLEKSLLPVTNVTIYVFLYPIASLHPQAPAKAHAIWCAKDRVQAWNDWMQQRRLPPQSRCGGDPIDALQRLGDQLHINSTPTLFFTSGRRVAGAMPTKELEDLLASSASPATPVPGVKAQ